MRGIVNTVGCRQQECREYIAVVWHWECRGQPRILGDGERPASRLLYGEGMMVEQ